MLWQPLECTRHGTNEYYFFMQILLQMLPLVVVVPFVVAAAVTGCQVGLAPSVPPPTNAPATVQVIQLQLAICVIFC